MIILGIGTVLIMIAVSFIVGYATCKWRNRKQ